MTGKWPLQVLLPLLTKWFAKLTQLLSLLLSLQYLQGWDTWIQSFESAQVALQEPLIHFWEKVRVYWSMHHNLCPPSLQSWCLVTTCEECVWLVCGQHLYPALECHHYLTPLARALGHCQKVVEYLHLERFNSAFQHLVSLLGLLFQLLLSTHQRRGYTERVQYNQMLLLHCLHLTTIRQHYLH